MHLSDCSCAPILQFFDVELDSYTANRQIPDSIFGQFFTSLRKDSVTIMHQFGCCFHLLIEDLVCFTTL